jgi:hypothetical protein
MVPVTMSPWMADSPNHDTPIAAMAQVGIPLAYDEGLSNREYTSMALVSAEGQGSEMCLGIR